MLGHRHAEHVVARRPALPGRVPLEERKLAHPQELPLLLLALEQRLAEPVPQHAEGREGWLPRARCEDHGVAILRLDLRQELVEQCSREDLLLLLALGPRDLEEREAGP